MLNLRIYIADDDQQDRELFLKVTNELGVNNVISFPNGKLLLESLKESHQLPDIIYLDINMPELTGLEILLLLKADPRFEHIPVIIYTTLSYPCSMAEALLYGASAYIVKPYHYSNLVEIIYKSLSIDWENWKPMKSNFLL